MSDTVATGGSTGVAERFIRVYEIVVIGTAFAVSVYKQALVSAINNDNNLQAWWSKSQFYVDNFYFQNWFWQHSFLIFVIAMFGDSALRYILLNEKHGGIGNLVTTIFLAPIIMMFAVLLFGWVGHFVIPTTGMNPASWVVQ